MLANASVNKLFAFLKLELDDFQARINKLSNEKPDSVVGS